MVNYWGRRYGSEKDVFWKDADMFVFPSYYYNECFPLVILEAMEQWLPVISTNEGGIPDEVFNGQTGYTVEKNDPNTLADSMERLFINPELGVQMGKAGRKLFEERFTEAVFEKRMKKCLENAINK